MRNMPVQPLDRQVRLHFTPLHTTSLLSTPSHSTPLHFTSLHFTSLHFTSFPMLSHSPHSYLPFVKPHRKYSSEAKLKTKQVDDVLGGADAWEDVDRVKTKCPFCDGDEAFFMQIQIRSADEPMTIFYKCCTCMKQWNQ